MALLMELMLGFEGFKVAHKLSAKSSPILASFLINFMNGLFAHFSVIER